MAKRIVVLGAGYAGILTAKKLEKKLRKQDVEITIIDKRPFHTMLTELHEVAAQRVEEDSIKIDLKRVFAGRNVNVVLDNVSSVDYDAKKVVGGQGEYAYDYLVLASGSQPTFFGMQGVKENAFLLWSYEDAIRLRNHITSMFQQAAMEPDENKKRFLLTFYIVGAGFTGVEMAGELAELAPILCKRFEIDPSYVTICDVDMLERVVPVLTEKLSAKVQRRMEKMGISVLLKTGISGVGEGYIEYKQGDKTVKAEAGTVIWTAGVEGSDIAKASGEALGAAGRGRIQTDEFLRSKVHANVFVVGDNIFFVPEGEKTPVPQMVENAEASAETAAHNLICAMSGIGEMEKYSPKFHGVMVCIGGRYGAAYVGTHTKKIALASFFAMFAKHFINIVYFIQVLGWNKISSYIYHEFFTVRNKRSFVGGHFSNRTPSFLMVPLRLFLGFYWIYEGWLKIKEGWMNAPMLTNFFQGANGFYQNILQGNHAFNLGSSPIVNAAANAADAVSSATAGGFTPVAGAQIVAELGNPIVANWNILGFINFLLVNAGEVAAKIKVGFIDNMVNNWIIPNDNVQMVFQVIIVLLEILVGLSLIGGLFTFVSSGTSLVLQMMFLTTTGLYMSSWWMLFAGFALLFRGGSVFGLDYWVMPALKKHWKNVGWVKKWYLYDD